MSEAGLVSSFEETYKVKGASVVIIPLLSNLNERKSTFDGVSKKKKNTEECKSPNVKQRRCSCVKVAFTVEGGEAGRSRIRTNT